MRFIRFAQQQDSEVSIINCQLSIKYDSVVAAEMHEGEEAEQSVVVSIEITVLEGLVLGVPQGIDELFALGMTAHHGSCC